MSTREARGYWTRRPEETSGEQVFVPSLNPTMAAIVTFLKEVAATPVPVLITGESGTGKQMVARLIHRESPAVIGTIRKLNCATLGGDALSSLIASNGSAEDAKNFTGTVLLDEIGDLDAEAQQILLHALPDGEMGDTAGIIRSRVVSTTSMNLEVEMREGRFRKDLYYRLNGVCLRLPPLRTRPEDIVPLMDFFLARFANELGRKHPALGLQTVRIFSEHSWPGNIRELENACKSMVMFGEEQVTASLLFSRSALDERRDFEPETMAGHSLKAAARAASRQRERELILKALARTRWNRKRAAQELQISYKSLLYKLKQIGPNDTERN